MDWFDLLAVLNRGQRKLSLWERVPARCGYCEAAALAGGEQGRNTPAFSLPVSHLQPGLLLAAASRHLRTAPGVRVGRSRWRIDVGVDGVGSDIIDAFSVNDQGPRKWMG